MLDLMAGKITKHENSLQIKFTYAHRIKTPLALGHLVMLMYVPNASHVKLGENAF